MLFIVAWCSYFTISALFSVVISQMFQFRCALLLSIQLCSFFFFFIRTMHHLCHFVFFDKTIELPSSSSYFVVDWFCFIYCPVQIIIFFPRANNLKVTDCLWFHTQQILRNKKEFYFKLKNKQINIAINRMIEMIVSSTGSFHFFLSTKQCDDHECLIVITFFIFFCYSLQK